MTEFAVKEGNVIEVPADLLLLKHAQNFYGADEAVASRLISAHLCTEAEIQPLPGDFVVIETKGTIAPKRVLFLGTPPLRSFTYNEMEVFARRAIEKIVDLGLPAQVLTTTVHGTGYGLDGGESLQRLVRGFREGLAKHQLTAIQEITFLTLGQRASRMLKAALAASAETTAEEAVTDHPSSRDTLVRGRTSEPKTTENIPTALPLSLGAPVVNKRHIFVAMPFSEEFENVYEFGIYPAVRNCSYICERVDKTHFVGDILGRIRERIGVADLVIADLTEGRPNVYLEAGYAWGREVPVIFLAKKGEELPFDLRTQRCIFYGKFSQLVKDLEELIRGIEATRQN